MTANGREYAEGNNEDSTKGMGGADPDCLLIVYQYTCAGLFAHSVPVYPYTRTAFSSLKPQPKRWAWPVVSVVT